MKYLLLAMLLVGCGNKNDRITRLAGPASLSCSPSGVCYAAQFTGFPEFRDTTIFIIAGGAQTVYFPTSEIVHPQLQSDAVTMSWNVRAGCTDAYTYQDPYSDTGDRLFPDGSKWDNYGLSWNLLCADIKGCREGFFFDIRDLVWHGDTLEVHDELGNVIHNQTFRYKGAVLHVAETGGDAYGSGFARGVRMELQGNREVRLSVVEQVCP